jgi:hypothetical protein
VTDHPEADVVGVVLPGEGPVVDEDVVIRDAVEEGAVSAVELFM